MNSLKKFGLMCVTLASLLHGCVSTDNRADRNKETFDFSSAKIFGMKKNSIIKPLISLGMDFQAGVPVNRIRNVPERMRVANATLLGDRVVHSDSTSPGSISDFRFGKLGIETRLHERFFLDIYASGMLSCSYLFGGFGSHDHDENVQKGFSKHGHERVYWGARYGRAFLSDLRADLHIKPIKDWGGWLVLGGGYRDYDLSIVNGRDKLGSFNLHDDEFRIGEIEEISAYIGLEGMSESEKIRYGLRLGAGFVDFDKKEKEVDVDFNEVYPFAGTYIEYRF